MRWLPTSFSLLGSSFDFTPNTRGTNYSTSRPGLLASCPPISMCSLRHLTCSTSFVACGMISSTRRKRRMVQILTHQRSLQISSDISGRATSRYTKEQMLRCSTLLLTIMPLFHFLAPRTLCAGFKITAMHLPRLYI